MWKKVLLFWLGIVVTVGVQAEGRTIKAFNDNWQFKRGPFPEDPVKWQAVWEKGWKEVQLPHTWNARDMQEQHNNFLRRSGLLPQTAVCIPRLERKEHISAF